MKFKKKQLHKLFIYFTEIKLQWPQGSISGIRNRHIIHSSLQRSTGNFKTPILIKASILFGKGSIVLGTLIICLQKMSEFHSTDYVQWVLTSEVERRVYMLK